MKLKTPPGLIIQALLIQIVKVQIHSANPGYCVDHGYTPENGSRTPISTPDYNYFPGSVIRYYCDEYFRLEPNIPMQQCQLNGSEYTWTPAKLPLCNELPVCPKPAISHANFSIDLYHEGDILQISCDDGYTVVQVNASVCLQTGGWSYLPSCKENECQAPPMIENGFFKFYSSSSLLFTETLPPGTFIIYTCNEGYQLEPSSQQERKCSEGQWSGTDPECVQGGCDPPDPSLGYYLPQRDHYEVHDTLTYICDPDRDVTRSCQEDHTWSGTPCPKALTTEQMLLTSSHNVYCTAPLPISHGSVKCCSGPEVTAGNASGDPKYCCPVHKLVEFVCNPGYSLKGEASHWICGSTGQWVVMDSSHPGPPSGTPTCYSNTTRPNPGPLSDDMLKPVIGVAGGVLVILSAAIIVAFCRPKIKDMKRRWRELREDEDELIIDGRRILLPSYEEAITSQDPHFQIIQHHQGSSSSSSSNYRDDIPGPSHSYYNQRTHSQNDTSRTLNSSREVPRPSTSSDEEMLLPEAANTWTNSMSNEQNSSGDLNAKISQPLILKAGTSVDACVLINHSPIKSTPTSTNNPEQSDSNPIFYPIMQQHNSVREGQFCNKMEVGPPPFEMGPTDQECNLESIYPQALVFTPNKTEMRPTVSDEANIILTYPLVPAENIDTPPSEPITIHIGQENGDFGECDGFSGNDLKESSSLDEKVVNCNSNESQPIIASSDHIHIVMSSQTPDCQRSYDEMGSTSV